MLSVETTQFGFRIPTVQSEDLKDVVSLKLIQKNSKGKKLSTLECVINCVKGLSLSAFATGFRIRFRTLISKSIRCVFNFFVYTIPDAYYYYRKCLGIGKIQ